MVIACAAVGALVVYRSMDHTSESLAQGTPNASGTAPTGVSGEQAIAAFFGEAGATQRERLDPVVYPGAGGTVTPWSVVVGGAPYRAWVGARDGTSFVVRVEAQTATGATASPTQTPGGTSSPHADSPVKRNAARLTAEAWAGNFEGFEELTALPLDPGPYPDGGTGHYVFTWQRQTGSTASSAGYALLPTWVTVWIDAATGELTAFDSLHRAAGNPQASGVKEEDVRDYKEAAGMDEFQIMAVPRLDAYGRWKTISVWMISDSEDPAARPAYVNASNGAAEDLLDLYAPDPWSLPRLAPPSDLPSPESSVVPGG